MSCAIFPRTCEEGIFYQITLHHLVYFETLKRFPTLASQLIIRAISKVADSYKVSRHSRHAWDRSMKSISKKSQFR